MFEFLDYLISFWRDPKGCIITIGFVILVYGILALIA